MSHKQNDIYNEQREENAPLKQKPRGSHTPSIIWHDGYAEIDLNDGHGVIATITARETKTNNVKEYADFARLTAAAPELLEAVKAAYQLATSERNDGDEVAALCREAITKATTQ